MHILVTNDDGITSPGLLALARAVQNLGKVSILAPDRNWSASGHVRTLDRPLRVKKVHLSDAFTAYASDGAPSDCVALATAGFFEEKIDLVVSGINNSANLGHDVTYSGTVTAAMEAAIWGIPALAFSLDTPENGTLLDYSAASFYARIITTTALANHLSPPIFLNVNLPGLPVDQIKGIQITRMGLRVYHDQLDRREDPRGKPYYWTIGSLPTGIHERGTDVGAIADGYVSVTPLQLDLTAHHVLPELKTWRWDFPLEATSAITVDREPSPEVSQPEPG
ncbi:MAG TPA: 5'/3'-nucleotidase SurE [Anaerolinea thermolimosa]|uniref:5'-nucleotidase SurE n=1 Tax=Anaerolinea thermolimosa TaxID=229919 RepID=A0A3D1JG51_9CHLR|nr:5'/3'-nucleotidase SurE [Anaerolinea thermolimosa]GAP06929.1 3'-nucleotidase [Anaerolinea thermolimosa]HCE17559.1 5'/3'-nucleotidase SurE [Anaerolinea thermolimosa]